MPDVNRFFYPVAPLKKINIIINCNCQCHAIKLA